MTPYFAKLVCNLYRSVTLKTNRIDAWSSNVVCVSKNNVRVCGIKKTKEEWYALNCVGPPCFHAPLCQENALVFEMS